MDKSIKELLEEELAADITSLDNLSPESEEYKKVADNIAKLHKLLMDENDLELKDVAQRHELMIADSEFELKLEAERDSDTRYKQDRRIQYVRIAVEIGGIVLPLVFYAIWMRKGFEFEEKGTITSSFFRNLINRIKPTK